VRSALHMAEVRLIKTDLPNDRKKPIKDAISLLYKRHVSKASDKKNKNASRGDFAKALKMSLDESFGLHWHVLVGEKLGFACKKRNQTMALFRVEESMVIIWQSPGIEAPEPAAEAADVAEEGSRVADASPNIKVLEPEKLEDGSTTADVVAALRSELAGADTGDTQELASALRTRLTADFGTIWHVAAGNDFVLEAAENRRNHVLLSANKMRIVCFQHEQVQGGIKVDWVKLLGSLPYLLLGIFCFAYMCLNLLCKDKPDPSQMHSIRNRVCGTDWEGNLKYVPVAALVCLFVSKRANRSAAAAAGGSKAKTA